jgi:stress-induced morphogen
MAQKTLTDPPYVAKLLAALRKRIPRAQIDCEQVRRDRFRFIVVSSKFDRLGHPERQRLVWNIAEKALDGADLIKVAMILTLSRKEFATSTSGV